MPQNAAGHLIRRWRTARGFSQMALALAARISSRQLSFIETGRGRPTRATLERLAEALAISRRERGLLMQAAGVTADAGQLVDRAFAQSVERSLAFLLDQHEPFPAWVIDRYTNLRMQNRASEQLLPLLLSPGYAPPDGALNLIRMLFDPDGLRLRIANWESLARTAVQRLELAVAADPRDVEMRALRDYVLRSAAEAVEWLRQDDGPPLDLIVPLSLRTNGPDINIVTAFTMLATADGMTIEDFYLTSFYPGDDQSRAFLTALAAADDRPPGARSARPAPGLFEPRPRPDGTPGKRWLRLCPPPDEVATAVTRTAQPRRQVGRRAR